MSSHLQTNKHKMTPEDDTNEKRKKIIIPDDYNELVQEMVDEMDYIEDINDDKIEKTPSMKKILKKIPANIKIHKIQEKSLQNQA